ncbi:MAG: cytochrome c oxidase subunit II [Deltaproteobacteria bacterium]|nr:cytochrome c oxidase subunit II [Nannocystaceae bacterium]
MSSLMLGVSQLLAPETKDAAKAAAAPAAEAAKAVAAPAAEAAKQAPKLPPLETSHSWAMPTDASNFAESTDNLYFFIVALSVFFFVLVVGAMVYFMAKYKRRSEDQKTSSLTHSGKIEFLWSAIPAVLLVVIFAWGEIDWVKQSTPPPDAINIRVTGRQWFWQIEYPDYPGVQLTSSTEEPLTSIIVPKGRPVRLTMTSEDVLHSFYVPAFRVKKDVVPGRYTTIWFEATRVGEFNLFCSEYCGDRHSSMTGVVKVLEPAMFEASLRDAGKLEIKGSETPAQFGERIYKRRGCNACHSVDGTAATGPTWKGIFGRVENLTDGSTVTVDENYIRESILAPQAKIVAGFTGANMPSYQGQLEPKHLDAIIEYMKTLK